MNPHYQFENAPENTTYVEVTGHFKGKDNKGMEVEADVKYTIHLGDSLMAILITLMLNVTIITNIP